MIPHVTDAIKEFVARPATRASTSCWCEIGGTVGDIEGLPFFEAIRQLGNELPRGNAVLHPPDPAALHPDGRRAEDQADPAFGEGAALDRHPARHPAVPLPTRRSPTDERRKIALFCNVRAERGDPGARRRHHLRRAARLSRRGPRRARCWPPSASTTAPSPTSSAGRRSSDAHRQPEGEVTIAVVGKYTGLKDAYKSLIEALSHGGIANKVQGQARVDRDPRSSSSEDPAPYLENVHGILVPGGFGERGSEGKILAAKFARERKVPYLRHLLRHADGGDRGGAQPGRHRGGRLDRVRPDRGAGRRPDDRMDAGQRAGEARARRRPRRHHAARRLSGARCARAAKVAEIYGDDADLRAPPPPLRGQHRLPRAAGAGRPALLPACRPTASCPRSIEIPTIPGSSACSIHPELKAAPVRAAPAVRQLHRAPRSSRAGWSSENATIR